MTAMSFAVCLHGPDLPRAGLRCQAYFDDETLVVESEPVLRVNATALAVSAGGFDDNALFLNWSAEDLRYAAVVDTSAARHTLLATAPAALRAQLAPAARQVDYHHFKWRAVLTALAVVALLLTLVLWRNEAATSWLADQISIETEERLGKTLLSDLLAGGELHKEGPTVDVIKLIGERLTKNSKYHYEWYLKDDNSVNAFAVPGGRVIVHAGLIAQAASAEELAGVLAHEVQHIELRHALRQMIHTAGWAAVLTVVLGDVSAITGVLVHQLGNLQYSRTLESEADQAGLHALARAGIPLSGMREFFARMQATEKADGAGIDISLLSSHPATSERLSEIERSAKQIPCTCAPLNIDWPALKAAMPKIDKRNKSAAQTADELDGI